MNKILMNEVIDGIRFDKLKDNVINVLRNERKVIYLDSSDFSNYEFNLEENAYLEINKIYNLGEVNEEVTINLNGINSQVLYNFRTLSSSNQKYIINVNHNNKNTISNVINRAVVLNDSRIIFEVNASVEKGNSGSVLNQENKIITMGDNNSEIRPNLYIDEFDVEARHSAIIGKFDKNEIFYLMMKGISYDKAKELLVKGFLKSHIGGD